MPPLARPPAHNSSSWPTQELASRAHVWPPPWVGTAGTTQPPLNYLFCTLLAQQREQPCLQASIKISRRPHRLPSHMPSSHQNWQADTSWDTTAHPRPARLPSSLLPNSQVQFQDHGQWPPGSSGICPRNTQQSFPGSERALSKSMT